jgi:hypothetical protein
MTNMRISLAWLALLALAAQDASAYVNLDDFQVNLLDHRINAGDTLQVILRFKNPDRNRSSDADIEILMNGTPVFRDEDYRLDFVEGKDKTVTITSDDFPGPDLDDDYYNRNLLKYDCGDYDIVVRVSGADFKDDLEERDNFVLGQDDRPLSIEINPMSPSGGENTVITAYDDDGRGLKGMSVKVTWLDDPGGSEPGRWDSEDKKASKETNSKGEATFNLTQKFSKKARGRFQVDAYGDRHCLSRKSFVTVSADSATAAGNATDYSGTTANDTPKASWEEPASGGGVGEYLKSLPERLSEIASEDNGTLRLLVYLVVFLAIILLLKNIVGK